MLELLSSRRLRLAETLILAVLRARSIEVAPARQIGSEHRISKSALCDNAYETPPYHTRYGEFFARKKFFEKIRFVELHKYSADFSVFRAGIRLFVQNFRLIFVQYAVSGDF